MPPARPAPLAAVRRESVGTMPGGAWRGGRAGPGRALQQVLAVLALLVALAAAPGAAAAQGVTVAIGGGLRDDTDDVWRRLAELVQPAVQPAVQAAAQTAVQTTAQAAAADAAAPATPAADDRACWHVITIASADPEAAAARVVRHLARFGTRAEHLRVGPRIAGSDAAAPHWAAALRRCRGVFLTGGAQARLLDTLRPQGRPVPLLLALQALWAEGGVVAGSSAGTAVLGAEAFRDAPSPLAVMQGRLRQGVEWERGFALLPPQVAIDQHALSRGRIARLLPLQRLAGRPLGVAVDDDAAAVFAGGTVEVLGRGSVLVAELAPADTAPVAGPFSLRGATLHRLLAGDRYVLATGEVAPDPARRGGRRLQPLDAPEAAPAAPGPVVADVLADGALAAAMTRVVDGREREVRALAFAAEPAADDPAPELGFLFRLRADAGTRGWRGEAGAGDTLAGVKLDIEPVRLQRPLWRAWTASPP